MRLCYWYKLRSYTYSNCIYVLSFTTWRLFYAKYFTVVYIFVDSVEYIHGLKVSYSTQSSRSRILYHNQELCIKQPQNNKTQILREMEYVKLVHLSQ